MEKYSEYKDSGVQWLGQIPGHWSCVKLKAFCKDNKEKNTGGVETRVLSLSYGNVIVKQDINFGLVPETYDSYQIVNPGYIILRLTDLQNDHKSLRTGLVKDRGIITSAYVGLIVKNMSCEYAQLLLHSYDIMKIFYGMGGGLRQSMSFQDISNLYIPIPPLPEQQAIVSYLDDKCAKLDRLVANKEKEIELLKEMKQRVIADAVTRGLNPDVKFKETGVFWQTKMPEHWTVRKLGHILKKLDRPRPENAELLICTNKGKVILRGDSKSGLVSETEDIYQGVSCGDLLIHGMDTWHGAIAVSENDGMCTPVVHVCTSVENVTFVAFYMQSMARNKVFKLISNGVRQNTSDFRSWNKVKPIPIPLPPLEEQRAIVSHINSRVDKIDTLAQKLQKEIENIKEYKQRLISDVVTGQIKIN